MINSSFGSRRGVRRDIWEVVEAAEVSEAAFQTPSTHLMQPLRRASETSGRSLESYRCRSKSGQSIVFIRSLPWHLLCSLLLTTIPKIRALTFSMAKIIAKCHKILEDEILRRSSQIVSVVGGRAYIFGGELRPREPRDNAIHAVSLGNSKLRRVDE